MFCPHCGHMAPAHATSCPENNVKPLAPKPRIVRLLHKSGSTFDFSVTETFDLNATVTVIRANGFLLVPGSLYCPESEIGIIFVLQDGAPPKAGESVVLPFPEKTP